MLYMLQALHAINATSGQALHAIHALHALYAVHATHDYAQLCIAPAAADKHLYLQQCAWQRTCQQARFRLLEVGCCWK